MIEFQWIIQGDVKKRFELVDSVYQHCDTMKSAFNYEAHCEEDL